MAIIFLVAVEWFKITLTDGICITNLLQHLGILISLFSFEIYYLERWWFFLVQKKPLCDAGNNKSQILFNCWYFFSMAIQNFSYFHHFKKYFWYPKIKIYVEIKVYKLSSIFGG